MKQLLNPNPRLSDLVDLKNLERRIEEGYISVSKSGTFSIYCYTKAAQYEQMWDNETMTCRGLITDGDRVVGRPFPKFFNYGQVEIPEWVWKSPSSITDKMDGSLGICFWNGERWQIATKGSFTSDQAAYGNALLPDYIEIDDPKALGGPGHTSLFEIIYPENRVVVDYHGTEALFYLTTIENRTASERWFGTNFMIPTALNFSGQRLDSIAAEVLGKEFDEKEGIVVRWLNPNGPAFRLKFKNARYLKLHALMTKMTARKIWAILKDEGYAVLRDFISEAPDEFQGWAETTADNLLIKHKEIKTALHHDFILVARKAGISSFGGLEPLDHEDRKRFAQIVADTSSNKLLFKMLDGKSIDDDVWKMIYPPHETPFMESDD